jgi:hypothetical protein
MLAAAAVADVRAGTPPRCDSTGAAVHLGGGRFLTAAHVVDGSVQRLRGGCAPGLPAITVVVRGSPAPATLLRAGQDRIDPVIGQRYLAGEDVALLAAGRLPGLGTAAPCAADPVPGTPAVLVTPRRALRTQVARLAPEPDASFGAYLEIPVMLEAGESGGALFEAASGCLAGLVSHRDEGAGPPRSRLVPASTLRRFLVP